MEPLEPLMPLLLWWKRGVSCRGQPCICGQMPLASGPRVSEQPSVCAGAEKSALGRPECRARSPQWSRLLAMIEAWFPSSIIQGLQLSPGPTGALLRTALSGKDGLSHVRTWRAGSMRWCKQKECWQLIYTYIGFRLCNHFEEQSCGWVLVDSQSLLLSQ